MVFSHSGFKNDSHILMVEKNRNACKQKSNTFSSCLPKIDWKIKCRETKEQRFLNSNFLSTHNDKCQILSTLFSHFACEEGSHTGDKLMACSKVYSSQSIFSLLVCTLGEAVTSVLLFYRVSSRVGSVDLYVFLCVSGNQYLFIFIMCSFFLCGYGFPLQDFSLRLIEIEY